MKKPHLDNKLKGILFGQAIGDALGLGCEFLNKNEIQKHYPLGFSDYVQIIQDDHRKRWGIGCWTDDTDQFLCVLDSFSENRGVISLNDIAQRLYDWFIAGGMGVGKLTYNVFKMPEYTKYPEKCAALAWNMTRKKSAPNGALMRNGAVSLIYNTDLKEALIFSESLSKLTHADQRCIDSCKIHTTLLFSLLNEENLSLEEIFIRSEIEDERTVEYINSFLSSDIQILDLDNENELGYTLKAVSSALWVYLFAESFEQGLLKIINEGGDSDTNGCVAGAILGAKFGFDSISVKWIGELAYNESLEKRYTTYNSLV